ncbi:alpha-amylase family glycosyl hydrolase [Natronoarchaeum rubrum]|uniref:alpha-amylase family glycosyl hydrolase n=1 Tax=Natronoarchaeum rubrum TaxID=755311 RepID=UPI002112920B|nr:alpha-amylase family glycosyl hydrolase [Natronoarchaeum rubrum]
MDFKRRQVLKAMGVGSFGLASGIGGASAETADLSSVSTTDVGSRVNYTEDVIYQVLTDRLRDGDTSNNPDGELYDEDCSELTKYCGGDWQGIIDKIEDGYLTDMGVTALWISPPFENVYEIHPDYDSAAYHGYWVRDLKSPNPIFGDMSDFQQLVDVAHQNDIKVVIDFIPNHTNPAREDDPSFMEDGALYDDGEYVASYGDDPGYFRHNGGIDFSSGPSYEETLYKNLYDLPDYALQSSFIDTYLKEAVEMWLDTGIDGIRVDAVAHMSPEWQKTLMDTIYEHRPVFTFGEWFIGADESNSRYYEFSNDSGMSLLDFRFGQDLQQVLKEFSDDGWNGFVDMLAETEAEHDQILDQVTFIDNHDMDRFTPEGGDTTNTDMALAVLLTSRGVPNIYYGTEQYMTGANEPGNPANRAKMASFDKTTTAYQVIQKLAPLRKENPALAYGDTQERWVNSDVLFYEREFGDNVVLVGINRSSTAWYDISGLFTALPEGTYSDELDGLIDGHQLTVNADGSVDTYSLGPQTVSVWTYNGSTTSPTLGHVGPTMGTPGNSVVVSGEGFGDATGSVQFGGTDANVVSWSDTEIEVTVPNVGGGEYAVSVTDANGNQSGSFDHFEVLTASQESVRFVVRDATTDPGESVYLVGNVPELGNWDTAQAVGPFFNQVEHEYPDWYHDVSVPAGTDLEFKFIKKDDSGSVTWESGSNRTYTTPADSTGEYDDAWK